MGEGWGVGFRHEIRHAFNASMQHAASLVMCCAARCFCYNLHHQTLALRADSTALVLAE